MQFAPGQTFARYIIDREIGHGGMGRVYLATDSVLKRKVALKMLLPERTAGEGPARFAREASLAAMVTHPNLVAIYDYGTADGQAYIAMEYVEGETLTAHLGDEAIPLTKRLLWLLDVGRALGAAHEQGLVHRDVKPSNVMVTRSGVVKVLDFGLAKQTTPTSGPRSFQTLEGRVLGTPRYMAPEQLQGRPVSAQTDQYGLGVLAYELITGVHPNGANGRVDPPKLLTELDPSLPFRLAVLVARTLAKKPEDRFPSMHELNAELERVISEVAPGSLDRATSPFGTGAGATPSDAPPPPAGPAQTVPMAPALLSPASTLPVNVRGVQAEPAAPALPAVPPAAPGASPGGLAETARGGRVPAHKTLPSPGAELAPREPSPTAPAPAELGKPPDLGTLRSAFDESGRPLGLAIDDVVRRNERAEPRASGASRAPGVSGASGAAIAPPVATPERRVPPPVVIVPASPPQRGWSKSMWLTVIAVGICGVIAGALLTAWAIGGSAPEPPGVLPAPSSPTSPR